MGASGGRVAIQSLEVVPETSILSAVELEGQLRNVGRERYHHKHPFHLLMHDGRLSRGQMQAWALNRYYYQSRIPIKDAIILSRRDRKSTRLNSSHSGESRMPSSA